MQNFILSLIMNLILIFIFVFVFKALIPGNLRHKLYEKFMSSFAKFVIYIFFITIILNGILAFIIYRLRYVQYINIIIPGILSILVGFIASTVPVKGFEEKK